MCGYYRRRRRGGLAGLGLGMVIGYAIARSTAGRQASLQQQRTGTATDLQYSQQMRSGQTMALDYNSYAAYRIPLNPGDSLKVDIEVEAGANIDIFLLDEENYSRFASGADFNFYQDYSSLNTRKKVYFITAANPGTHILLVDNTIHPAGQAQPDMRQNQGRVQVRVLIEGTSPAQRIA